LCDKIDIGQVKYKLQLITGNPQQASPWICLGSRVIEYARDGNQLDKMSYSIAEYRKPLEVFHKEYCGGGVLGFCDVA